ncbi:hypothetical protein FOV72_19705 [Gordonia rubripertincta]|uniref:hypothetical protein n=1 Tax=Gordonia rubripertincta TaxID=36822 RepID=UPI00117EE0C8|nr:hypothetical protein [Gordonia rubripertincta]TSD93488.1 hypothetical protein FOV72_19705 [Gordonia rubripertincta]
MNRLNTATTRLWLAIDQPSPDPGPFAAVWDKIGGIVFWATTIGGLSALAWAGTMLAWEKLDPTREPKSAAAIGLAVVGGIVAASSAQIINWAYGT